MQSEPQQTPKAKKWKSQLCARKVMMTMFIDYENVLLLDFKELDFGEQYLEMFTSQQDITRPHVAHTVQNLLAMYEMASLKTSALLSRIGINLLNNGTLALMLMEISFEFV